MTKRDIFNKYLRIVHLLRWGNYLTYENIEEDLQKQFVDNGDFQYSKRTFQRDINNIYDLFAIRIEYSRTENGYYISTDEIDENNFNHLIESFDLIQSMMQIDKIRPYFHLEDRKPTGTQYIQQIVNAIKHRRIICFSYHKNWKEIKERKVSPLLLKESKFRWYLVAQEDKKNKIFALDRMSGIFETGDLFTYPEDFDGDGYFKGCIDIWRSDGEIQDIVFQTDERMGNYFVSKPIHESQKLISETSATYTFKVSLIITPGVETEFLSYGENIKILEPKSLVKTMCDRYRKTLKQYED